MGQQIANSAVIQVDGLCEISVTTGSAFALEVLGFTRNGAEVTGEAFWIDVPGDQWAGDDGPPIDVQYVGEIERVRLELTKFDNNLANKLKMRLNDAGVVYDGTSANAGKRLSAGTLVFANSFAVGLLLRPLGRQTGDVPQRPLYFPRAIPRMPVEENKGTKFSTLILEFECHQTLDTDTVELRTSSLWNEDNGGNASAYA